MYRWLAEGNDYGGCRRCVHLKRSYYMRLFQLSTGKSNHTKTCTRPTTINHSFSHISVIQQAGSCVAKREHIYYIAVLYHPANKFDHMLVLLTVNRKIESHKDLYQTNSNQSFVFITSVWSSMMKVMWLNENILTASPCCTTRQTSPIMCWCFQRSTGKSNHTKTYTRSTTISRSFFSHQRGPTGWKSCG